MTFWQKGMCCRIFLPSTHTESVTVVAPNRCKISTFKQRRRLLQAIIQPRTCRK